MYGGDEYNQGYQGQEDQGGYQQQRGYGQQQTDGYQQQQQEGQRGGYQGRGRGRGGGGYRGGRGGGQGGGQGYQQRENGPSVFVGNIPWAATEEELRTIFSDFGNVIRFRILQDRETGRPRGMGFCEFENKDSCQAAIDGLNGYDFSGRELRVDHAKPRQ